MNGLTIVDRRATYYRRASHHIADDLHEFYRRAEVGRAMQARIEWRPLPQRTPPLVREPVGRLDKAATYSEEQA